MDYGKDRKMVDDVDDNVVVTEKRVRSHIEEFSFKISEPKLVGAEFEWLIRDAEAADRPVPPSRTFAALAGLHTRGVLSAEPGGQLELSSQPADLETCLLDVRQDIDAIQRRLINAGLELAGMGIDPYRPPHMFLNLPRYVAMRESFDRVNDAGRLMLFGTASVQVAIDAGQEGTAERSFRLRWHAANALAPILTAIFANSPMINGRLTGWKSSRQDIWRRIDPTRTRPPRPDVDPREAWAEYVLDANVVCVRRPAGQPWSAPAGLTFRQWIAGGIPRRPTVGDLRYHLTTLFPPVRPRGYLELRTIDAQPEDKWLVPVAVTKALLDDARAIDLALDAVEPLRAGSAGAETDVRVVAAERGLSDPVIARAAARCFAAALAALSRMAVAPFIVSAVEDYGDRYVGRGRCPADDVIESARG